MGEQFTLHSGAKDYAANIAAGEQKGERRYPVVGRRKRDILLSNRSQSSAIH